MDETFGRWTVVRDAPPRRRPYGTIPMVVARCSCGKRRLVQLPNLRSGKSKSCGCFRAKRTAEIRIVHGDARKGFQTVEYYCWQAMRRRCLNPRNPGFENYGGRGISICPRWSDYSAFLVDMGRKPSPSHSLERKNVDGNYEPSNCRWATAREQRSNQRRRARIDQFTDAELAAELVRRGYANPLRIPQHH